MSIGEVRSNPSALEHGVTRASVVINGNAVSGVDNCLSGSCFPQPLLRPGCLQSPVSLFAEKENAFGRSATANSSGLWHTCSEWEMYPGIYHRKQRLWRVPVKRFAIAAIPAYQIRLVLSVEDVTPTKMHY